MTLAKTNQKLVYQLRCSLNIAAVNDALNQGKITPQQARNINKFISSVHDVRENPIHVVADDDGKVIGDVQAQGGGASWLAKRYGNHYPNDAAEFFDFEKAVAFIKRV